MVDLSQLNEIEDEAELQNLVRIKKFIFTKLIVVILVSL